MKPSNESGSLLPIEKMLITPMAHREVERWNGEGLALKKTILPPPDGGSYHVRLQGRRELAIDLQQQIYLLRKFSARIKAMPISSEFRICLYTGPQSTRES